MSEEKLNQEELLAVESSVLSGLLAAHQDQKDDTTTIEIARKGKVLFSFDIHALTEKQYHDLQDKATKFRKAKNLGGVKVAEETDITRFRSLLIYHATVKEDRQKIWDDKEAWRQLNVPNGIHLIDVVLKAGEKKAIIDKIDEISGYTDDADEIIKNSLGQEDE
ncbi:phage tail assembly chaperone [Sporosarcina sp. FSL K6-1508]|uniref:phage tail assembly chaperone n=1 Tax=Sporosarcina sp. FSL K6-1508 TaxID=2921553 RepID=UPI0030F73E05